MSPDKTVPRDPPLADGAAPSLLQAITPVLVLVGLLAFAVYLFGEDSSYGPNQIALCVGATIAALIGWRNGICWTDLETSMVQGISVALRAILILFTVGLLIGSWIMAGTVPTMIYYSLLALDPAFFYAASCTICAVVALSIGSSWTVAGTIGVALIGAAAGLGLSLEITAGAIISGAYFGDKLSPLSDTTNLAPAVVGTDLFTHIHHMLWTTVPSIVIALFLYLVIGFNIDASTQATELQGTLDMLQANFRISPVMLLPVLVLLVMANKKLPPLPTILTGALAGILFAFAFQQPAIRTMAADIDNGTLATLKGMWQTLFDGYKIDSGDGAIDDLLSRGGMSSMLNTVWLIFCAMIFGALMDRTGLIQVLVRYALSTVRGTGSLVITTLLTCIGANIIASDQYIAIVLPGRMYKMEFQRRGLDVKNLSRILEDGGTITSPLVPWNTCGAFMSGTLGVATLAYLPFCFFNLINPLVSAFYGIVNFQITPAHDPVGMAEDQPA
ncbi:MAG: Na+/H+ antiporter NhaC [Gammaproteobacteria bacterium]|jgi:NhaC family Na+:H+ antiporter